MAPEKIGRYQIKSELGRGGMATVYEAYDPRFEREVAIKVLPREMLHDPQFRVRFEREAKTIALLEHPAIVPVYDYGEEDGQPYFVMRYMTGGSLSDRIRKGALTLQEAAHIMNRLAPALDEAHAKGIIHRDMKPGNILFDRVGEPYLADFGIAKLAESQINVTGSGIIGTPAYMSPEQAQGESIDGRSDIYALGTILFEMLTGQQPYKGDTPMSVVVKHITEPVPHILEVKPTLPPAIEQMVEKTMAKRRDERFATARDFAAALNAIARGETPNIGFAPTLIDVSAPHAEKKAVPFAGAAVPGATVIAKHEGQAKPPVAAAPVAGPKNVPPRKKSVGWIIPLVAVFVLCIAAAIGVFVFRDKIFPVTVATALPTQTPISTKTEAPAPTATANAVVPSPLPTVSAAASSTPAPMATATAVSLPALGGADKIALLGGNNVWVMNVDGGDLQQLTTDGADKHDLQWTPDGENVVYISGTCVNMVNINTKQSSVVVCFNSAKYLDAFEISPDGTQVAISLDRELYVVPYNLKVLSTVKARSGLEAMNGCFSYNKVGTLGANWSNDGRKLAVGYLLPEGGRTQESIRVIDIHLCEDNNPHILDNFPEQRFTMTGYGDNPIIPSFDWDGDLLFLLNSYVRNDGYGYLYSYNMQAYQGKPLDPLYKSCCYRDAHWSPDGNYVIFAYQDVSKGADVQTLLYYIPFGTFGTGSNYTSLPLPDGFFKNPKEKPQPALRPVR
jgi:Tol biopolymer transport system component/tRNA A-37 threonylcarbamoyl transferase component Bud32